MATIGAIPSPPPKWEEEIFEVDVITNQKIELLFAPTENSQFVVLNGSVLTNGVNYDYTISGKEVVFNNNVLTTTGHVLVKYSYA